VSAPPEDGGRRESFEAEALPHLDAVYRFALRLTGAPDRAEDLVQDTFLRAYRAWDQYTQGTQCKSWLFTICRNLFVRQWERGQRHEEILAENVGRDGPGAEPAGPVWSSVEAVDPEGAFFASFVDEEILRSIDLLPEEYRMAVLLSDIEGLTYDEIAALLNVPVGTVKSRLFRGRRRLQQVLFDYAVENGYLQSGSRPQGRGAAP
jgi:RNA polymerase sigma-70 factor (ECF subfamily)